MNPTAPIGIFDSGVGGTSIWKEIQELLPGENTVYLADSRNAPYGQRSRKQIVELSIKNTECLLQMGAKMVVVACNTATTNAISILRNRYDVPFIGIEPAIKPAALQTQTKSIGILATKGTLSSELFSKTAQQYTSSIRVMEVVGEGLVPLIEDGKIDSPEMDALLQKYLTPMVAERVDCLVLGCTHYPYLIPKLQKILPESVVIIDSGKAVAKQVKNILYKKSLLNKGKTGTATFYSNRGTETLTQLLSPMSDTVEISFLEF